MKIIEKTAIALLMLMGILFIISTLSMAFPAMHDVSMYCAISACFAGVIAMCAVVFEERY